MNPRPIAVISCLIVASISASGQILIDTFAGGHVVSGVSAQNVAFGIISGVTRDPGGNLVFCDSTTNVIRRINADGTIQTIAGTGIPGFGGDGGPAIHALLNDPAYPRYDSAGDLYFLDTTNHRIRRIDTSGIITTVAGTGIQGTLGADGPATEAQIDYVTDLAVDTAGRVYFAETEQANLRRLTPSGKIEVYALCSLCAPSIQTTLATDSSGNVYLSNQSQIFRISSDGVVHNFAGFGDPSTPNMGNGDQALKAPPSGFIAIAADAAGNLYTEDEGPAANGIFVVRRIGTDGVITVVAGTFTGTSQSDGPALQTELFSNYGSGLIAEAGGSVTFAEDYKLRRLTTQSTIQTLAPTRPTPAPEGTAALDAWFIGPNSIAFNRAGELYVGQTCIIQKVDSSGLLSTVAGTGQCSTTPPSGPALSTQLTAVNSVAVDSHDQVYFADTGGVVYVVSKAVISKVADLSSGQQGIFPRLAIDSQDRLYFASFFGVLDRIAPGSPPQDFTNIHGPGEGEGIAVDAADNIYVCCRYGLNGLIERYTPDLHFTFVNTLGFTDGSFPPAYGIAVDSSSNIWQGNSLGLAKGTLPFGCCAGTTSGYGDGGAAESAYISASALAFAPNGDLYVLESGTNSVRRVHGSPPSAKPVISSGGIVNALSYAGAAVAPGELISIFGTNFGPSGLDVYRLQNNFVPAALNNVHVYFSSIQLEGKITARTPNQINVFVPYWVSALTSVQVIVDVDGVTSDPVTVPVAPSAFGLATHDGSGSGQGAILNQDGSLNSHANPAARGSIVVMFGTGEGVTTPALPDGALVISIPYPKPGTVSVAFGNQNAEIQYAGAAPFLPTGVLQINATIPTGVTPGDVPIKVSIDGISTTRTVTVSVQ